MNNEADIRGSTVSSRARAALRKPSLYVLLLLIAASIGGWKIYVAHLQDEMLAHFTPVAAAFAPFELKDAYGHSINLSAKRGKPVLVYFFATWHEESVASWEALTRFGARERGKINIIGIALDESDRRIQTFLKQQPAGFPVGLDHNRVTADAWEVNTLPTAYVLDEKLEPRLVAVELIRWDRVSVEALLKKLRK